jgi:hypothetical protein
MWRIIHLLMVLFHPYGQTEGGHCEILWASCDAYQYSWALRPRIHPLAAEVAYQIFRAHSQSGTPAAKNWPPTFTSISSCLPFATWVAPSQTGNIKTCQKRSVNTMYHTCVVKMHIQAETQQYMATIEHSGTYQALGLQYLCSIATWGTQGYHCWRWIYCISMNLCRYRMQSHVSLGREKRICMHNFEKK